MDIWCAAPLPWGREARPGTIPHQFNAADWLVAFCCCNKSLVRSRASAADDVEGLQSTNPGGLQGRADMFRWTRGLAQDPFDCFGWLRSSERGVYGARLRLPRFCPAGRVVGRCALGGQAAAKMSSSLARASALIGVPLWSKAYSKAMDRPSHTYRKCTAC